MRTLLILACLLGFAISAYSQDLITKKNGEEVQAKVLEIDGTMVKYRLFNEPDGAIYTIRKSEILMINFESGRKEIFNTDSDQSEAYNNFRAIPEGIRPGMKYKQYKNLYNTSEYMGMPGDPHTPWVAGVTSFLIPGLGQMICGEVGRGFAYLGGTIGIGLVGYLGAAGLFYYGKGYMDGESQGNNAALIAGTVLLYACSFGVLALDICAIVDAVKVAKIKNMYIQDLRKQSMAVDMKLYPSVNYVPTAGSGMQPTVGMTFALNF